MNLHILLNWLMEWIAETVNLEVKSVGENWSTVKDAKITLDSEVEL